MTQTAPIPSSPTTSHFGYRPDIDGLRAIAVLAVVAFHLGFASLEGGFLGVDIFFVISGFLITSIIAPKMMTGGFSFKDFYLKRIRRLIPPALVTVAATFVVSAFILDPTDLLAMAKSSIAAVFSVSNILFFSEAGYWDAQSELKPLLHTWSLGVEEQFYLFWPLLVFLMWKVLKARHFVVAFAIITILGIVVSEWMLRANPSAAFYLLPARVFEFSIGACFAFIAKSELWTKIGNMALCSILGWISLLVIIATILIYKGETPFPGINGILPCLATATLMLCGAGARPLPVLGPLLSNSVMTWIGRVSYSLYLVHWPVVSLMRYKVGSELHLDHQIISAALMVVLTLALYYGVERRISARAGQSKTDKVSDAKPVRNGRFAMGTGLVALSLSAIFAHAVFNSGWTWRFSNLSFTPEQVKAEKRKRFSTVQGSCTILNFPYGKDCVKKADITALIFGNSHEPDGFNFFEAAYDDPSKVKYVRFEQTNLCSLEVVEGEPQGEENSRKCQQRLKHIFSPKIANQFDIIIYSSNRPFAPNKAPTLSVLKRMKEINSDLKLVSMGGYINSRTLCARLINEAGNSAVCVLPENVKTTPKTDLTDALYDQFMEITDYYLDKGELLCGDIIPDSCESETPDRIPYSYDQHHLSLEFAQYAGRKFADQNPRFFEDLMAGRPNSTTD